jgi:hypothetical protein
MKQGAEFQAAKGGDKLIVPTVMWILIIHSIGFSL